MHSLELQQQSGGFLSGPSFGRTIEGGGHGPLGLSATYAIKRAIVSLFSTWCCMQDSNINTWSQTFTQLYAIMMEKCYTWAACASTHNLPKWDNYKTPAQYAFNSEVQTSHNWYIIISSTKYKSLGRLCIIF